MNKKLKISRNQEKILKISSWIQENFYQEKSLKIRRLLVKSGGLATLIPHEKQIRSWSNCTELGWKTLNFLICDSSSNVSVLHAESRFPITLTLREWRVCICVLMRNLEKLESKISIHMSFCSQRFFSSSWNNSLECVHRLLKPTLKQF